MVEIHTKTQTQRKLTGHQKQQNSLDTFGYIKFQAQPDQEAQTLRGLYPCLSSNKSGSEIFQIRISGFVFAISFSLYSAYLCVASLVIVYLQIAGNITVGSPSFIPSIRKKYCLSLYIYAYSHPREEYDWFCLGPSLISEQISGAKDTGILLLANQCSGANPCGGNWALGQSRQHQRMAEQFYRMKG